MYALEILQTQLVGLETETRQLDEENKTLEDNIEQIVKQLQELTGKSLNDSLHIDSKPERDTPDKE